MFIEPTLMIKPVREKPSRPISALEEASDKVLMLSTDIEPDRKMRRPGETSNPISAVVPEVLKRLATFASVTTSVAKLSGRTH